jgi:2-succinyl-5-enolpyruvyl-6-hydroxy-3-cyclohexene-1-carboxylate synthase
VALVLGIIARELWRGRQRLDEAATWWAEPTPLAGLEPAFVLNVGSRPLAMSLAQWLEPLMQPVEPMADALRRALVLHQQLSFDPNLRTHAGQRQRCIDELRQICSLLRRPLRQRALLQRQKSDTSAMD